MNKLPSPRSGRGADYGEWLLLVLLLVSLVQIAASFHAGYQMLQPTVQLPAAVLGTNAPNSGVGHDFSARPSTGLASPARRS